MTLNSFWLPALALDKTRGTSYCQLTITNPKKRGDMRHLLETSKDHSESDKKLSLYTTTFDVTVNVPHNVPNRAL